MKLPYRTRGFTIVELAIVLVIIGIILGGLIVGGSSVMESARTSSLVGQIKDLATAARDFKSRYGYFPGDLPNAATLITSDGGISAGCSYAIAGTIGTGLIDSATESTCALEHLVKARMISKVEMVGGNYVIHTPFGNGTVSLGSIAASQENVVVVTNLPCNIALQIDGKLDNASATPLAAGNVTALDAGGGAINTCTTGGANDPVATLRVRY